MWSHFLLLHLHTLSTELNLLEYVLDQSRAEVVLVNEELGQLEVVVSLVEEDAVGAMSIDFYFDDGWVGREVPMRGPRVLFRDYPNSIAK